MMLIRANVLAKGFSGIRPLVAERLCELLNRGVTPVVPSQGSVGASGDLAPLAHIALVLMGEGEAELGARRQSGGEALRRPESNPSRWHPRKAFRWSTAPRRCWPWACSNCWRQNDWPMPRI